MRVWAAAMASIGFLLGPTACALAQATPQERQQGPAQDQKGWTGEFSRFALHGQLTNIWQYHPAFRSKYQGPQSLDRANHVNETTDVTIFAGVRPWRGGELWLDLEMDQGIAPSNTLGVAGYVNGDGAKVGKRHPYTRPQRLFLRQTWDLGGERTDVDPDINQFSGKQAADRVVLTIGKFNATDVFDTNKYAHDPRHDFLNWSLIDAGTFDYAADAWGYTYGAAVELYREDWTWRAGLFDMSDVPNSKTLNRDFSERQWQAEVERRYKWRGQEGAVRVTGFLGHARFGRYDEALALAARTGGRPDTALVRRWSDKGGVSVNWEQALSKDLGVFARAGWADGAHESYEYADIDRTVQAGVSMQGARWGRPDDTAALAAVLNAISPEHHRYFAAGGLGILVGDGRQSYGAEKIVESFYSLRVIKPVTFTFDAQLIQNPAYNRDRGPVVVFSGRLHVQL